MKYKTVAYLIYTILLAVPCTARSDQVNSIDCNGTNIELAWNPIETGYALSSDGDNNLTLFKDNSNVASEQTSYEMSGPSMLVTQSTLKSVRLSCERATLVLNMDVDYSDVSVMDGMDAHFVLKMKITGHKLSMIKGAWRIHNENSKKLEIMRFQTKLKDAKLLPSQTR